MDMAQNTPFDPTATTSGSFSWTGGDGTQLVVINESYINMYLVFGGGQKAFMPANDKRKFKLTGIMAQPSNVAQWQFQSGIAPLNTVNQVVVEVYSPGEETNEAYPAPLIRQANVTS